MLIELLIAMTLLAIGVGALLSLYASTHISLRHASVQGNAFTLVDKQMELLRTFPYSGVKLDASTIPSGTDPYMSSPPSNLSPAQQASIASGQVTGGTMTAAQTVAGPDGRTYRIDLYLFSSTPPNGQAVVQGTVAARLVENGTVGSIKAQLTSAIDIGSTQVPPS